ncbi:DUF6710 family protein [Lactococcus lactis]|uniref:DUF6710 family protein n=1 Tax=Lactococcus lactis TaxID=1358 RepID=UPI0022E46119|nr:DUF6710 family protein [Lactococcus lactis]
MLDFFKSKTEKPQESSKKNSKEIKKEEFERIIEQARIIISDYETIAEEIHPIYSFAAQFTNYISYKHAMEAFKLQNNSAVTSIDLNNLLRTTIFKDFVNQIEFYTNEGDNETYHKLGILISDDVFSISLNQMPLITSAWKYDRITRQMLDIQTPSTPFDSKQFNWNLDNKYLYPMPLINCEGGNHSQYVARIKGDAQTRIRSIIDISKIYDFVQFDGNQFIYKYPEQLNYLSDSQYEIEKEEEFYIGVLYEIGRLILNFEEEKQLTSPKIISAINNAHKV